MVAEQRKPFVGGNWKCNGTQSSVKELITALAARSTEWSVSNVDAVLAPSSIQVHLTQGLLKEKGLNFQLAVQNVGLYGLGAYTGEIAIEMAKDLNVGWALVGHSERRHKFGESVEHTSKKVALIQNAGISVIFCIGELLEERQAGRTDEVCAQQLEGLFGVVKDWDKIVIAYEPVWAIGTGVVATTAQAQEAHDSVRALISTKVGKEIADKVRIIYGGSVTPENCRELIEMPDVDGFLVGGASLKPSFTDIIVAAANKV